MSLLSFSHGLQSCHLPDLWQTQVEQQTGKRDEWMRGKFWFVAADGWAANCLPSCGLCDNIASPLLRCLLDRHSFLCLAFCVLCFSVKESLYQFSPQTLRCLWAAAVKPCVIYLFFHVFLINVSFYSSPRNHWKLYFCVSHHSQKTFFYSSLWLLCCCFFPPSHFLWLTDSCQEKPRVNR